ncbi:AN1-like Zinc finger [Nesidiocoris tenuis]|uniref:AN1-like Zinc finger n=1 Tax=Nesidiocoris tenuis TaxID=355587 RepID=A0ABN7AGN2_9HEMI|nr:AN1-like Zinc finger [Nesidiocoris tenuis]
MELPHLGRNCSDPSCNKLDFLPVKCDACAGIFCHDHMSYNTHNCIEGKKRDYQVPVCPLCNQPVPSKRGVTPDIAVGAHIDADCNSDKAKNRRKVFANRCHYKSCKNKEMMQLKCSQCGKNHCLSHRHPTDHECTGRSVQNNRKNNNHNQPARTPNNAALYQKKAQYVQGSMSEDEALARAIELSLASNNAPMVGGETRRSTNVTNGSNCALS